jgi:hypothetical protein
MRRITALHPVTIAVVLGLVAVALLATIWLPLPYWLDVARLEIILLTVFGVPAALVAGRAAYRVALASVALIVAMALQIMFGYILQGPGCSEVLMQVPFAIMFGSAWLFFSTRIILAGIVIVAPLFAYGVLSRASPLVRLGAVVALLVAVFAAAAIIGQVQSASMINRCLDF